MNYNIEVIGKYVNINEASIKFESEEQANEFLLKYLTTIIK